jgi:hypothetical protein
MPSLSEQIAGLEKQYAALQQQQALLQKQMEEVATRLTKIRAAFERTAPKRGNGAASASSIAAKKPRPQGSSAKAAKQPVSNARAQKRVAGRKAHALSKPAKTAKRAWFEPGEAVALIRRTAKKPMHQRDLVQALAEAKGDAGKLSGDLD